MQCLAGQNSGCVFFVPHHQCLLWPVSRAMSFSEMPLGSQEETMLSIDTASLGGRGLRWTALGGYRQGYSDEHGKQSLASSILSKYNMQIDYARIDQVQSLDSAGFKQQVPGEAGSTKYESYLVRLLKKKHFS